MRSFSQMSWNQRRILMPTLTDKRNLTVSERDTLEQIPATNDLSSVL
jgi:hypothetical protein